MNIFVIVVCAVLMVLGIGELLRLIAFWWRRPTSALPFSIVVAPHGPEDCEAVVRAMGERIRWLELKGPCKLVCLNTGDSREIERICRLLALRYPYLEVCKTEDLVYHILDEN